MHLMLRWNAWWTCGLVLASCSSDPAMPPPPPLPCQALTAEGGGVAIGSGDRGDPAIAVPASRYTSGRTAVTTKTYMVVAANPLASRAGCEVLAAGGTAIDAAIAVQMVLGLVEPQSSGLGGGAFLLYYDAAAHTVQAYDGRETAPAAATEDYLRFVSAADPTTPRPTARASGRSIGTPGVLRMLELAYKDHGRTAWRDLFTPAIELATDGFQISGRLAFAIDEVAGALITDDEAAATYLKGDGSARSLGTALKVPAYATTLAAVAAGGAEAFYTGEIAQAIVDKIGAAHSAIDTPITPGLTTLGDLAGYEARRRDAICVTYRAYWICGMPPPSSGGLAVAQTLGILEGFDLAGAGPGEIDADGGKPAVAGVHLVSEAERLAYADRDKYVADTEFVALPGGGPEALLDRTYLASRAALIRPTMSMGTATAGDFNVAQGVDRTGEHGTSQVTVVDADGNVATMTTTIESSFGSFHMARGVVLNNQLTDFSAAPADGNGAPIANRVAAGKRPRSSLAPTLVFHRADDGSRGELAMATGSPGGATIIQYVVKTLVGVLDWGLDAQQAAAMVDFGAANDPVTNVGGEHPDVRAADNGSGDPLVTGLRALGHTVVTQAQSSGIATVVRALPGDGGMLVGGADPRRDGLVLGDTVVP